KALGELGATLLADLATRGGTILAPTDFPAIGAVPAVAALKAGNGLTLRNAYVRAFGSQVTAAGATNADALSDAWKGILGYRPLALTRVPGLDPTTLHADDAVMDADGNVVVAPHNTFLIYLPAKDRGPLPGSTTALTGGKLYALVGQVNGGTGPGTLDAYNQLYGPMEQASVADPASAPLATDGAPIWLPYRLMLEQVAAAAAPHVFFTSRQGHRLYMIPGADLTRFGRTFQAGRLYTLAGFGKVENPGDLVIPDDPNTPALDESTYSYLLGDDGPAYQAPLAFPHGVAQDSRHNLYLCDAGGFGAALATSDPNATTVGPFEDPNFPGRLRNVYHQSVRLIRAGDGKIFTFHLTKDGAAFPLSGALDLRVAETATGNWCYVSDSLHHCVVRFALPANLADLDAGAPAVRTVEVVLGTYGLPGVRTATAAVPGVAALNDGVPKAQVLLDTPTGLEIDASGNLVVADNGRLRLLDLAAGLVYPIAGSLPAGFDEGDSRLVTPHARYVTRQSGTGNLVVVDDPTGAVLRLGGARGLR
ncbi:MAG: copper amine oxidase, partial [Cyanobacteria bacterium RYN_339]|nr:copper amine oxidase [Cyanobacteria bacterium RYN_339]